MAVAFGSALTANWNPNQSDNYSTASVSWNAGDFVVIAIAAVDLAGLGPVTSVTASGLTFTAGRQLEYNDDVILEIWGAYASSSGSGAITINNAGAGARPQNCSWSVFTLTGVDPTNPWGTAATDYTTSTAGTVIDPNFAGGAPNKFVVAAAAYGGTTHNSTTCDHTEVHDIGFNDGAFDLDSQNLCTQYDADGASATPGFDTPSTSTRLGIAIVVEEVAPTGSGAISLQPVTVAGAGDNTIPGTGALGLQPVTASGAGTAAGDATGSGAMALEPVTVAGAGYLNPQGAGAIVLEAVAASGAGVNTFAGLAALLLEAVELAGSGVTEFPGTAALALEAIEASGVGGLAFSGSGAIGLEAVVVTSAGYLLITGTGALLLEPVAVGASGAHTVVIHPVGSVAGLKEPPSRLRSSPMELREPPSRLRRSGGELRDGGLQFR